MRASPKCLLSQLQTDRKRKNGAVKIQWNILGKSLQPDPKFQSRIWVNLQILSTPCLIPFEIFAFRSSSMKRNREGTHKFPKPIKKVIQKIATVIRKPNKAADNQVKTRLKAAEEEEEEEAAHSQGGISVPRTLTLPSSFLEKWPILTSDFYQIDALDLAPRLLGKYLRRDDVVLQITEVEAYRPNDSACHGRFGITARTAPVFGPGGHAYVYLCYGLHTMLNIVADKEGVGAAVLVRSCAPINGLETIQQRRGIKTEKPILLTGPGKVGQALGISTEWSHHSLFTPGGLELLNGPKPDDILVGPRVGIDYALPEHVNALWRFAIAGTPWISAPKSTLRPS